jgi:MFS family permease
MKTTQLQRLCSKLFAFAFFDELILIYPFYTLLFADRGLSAAQITSLLMVWSATTFLLEVPSGAIADKFSRKHVMILSLLIRLVGFSSWLLFQNYWGFFAGFVLWGINSALASGTQEALVYDELARLKHEEKYAKVMGRMEAFGITGALLASFIAGLLANQGYSFMLACSLMAIALAVIPLLMLPTSKAVESTGETKYVAYLVQGVRGAFTKPAILIVVLFSSAVLGLASNDEYFNLLLREKSLDNGSIAIWLAVVGAFGIVGSSLAHRLEGKKIRLEFILVLWGVVLLTAALGGAIVSAISLGLFTMVFYIIKILFNAKLQHAVGDKTRATTTSVVGLLSELGALSVFAILGWSASTDSYALGFILLSAIIVSLALCLWLLASIISKRYNIEKFGL